MTATGGVVPLPGGGEVAYEVAGAGGHPVPILLVRPLGGTTALWGAFREALAAGRRVLAFDHRGAGRSSAAPTVVTTAGLARDALAVLDHLAVERADVFGISLGGMTATELVLLAPGRVGALCLASTPARGTQLTGAGLRRELSLAAAFAARPGAVEGRLVRRTLSSRFRAERPDEVARIERVVRSDPASPAALLKHALAGATHDVRARLGSIEARTLVVAGEDDTLLGVDPCRELADAIPDATLEVVAGAGHDLTLERPMATAAQVQSFFASR